MARELGSRADWNAVPVTDEETGGSSDSDLSPNTRRIRLPGPINALLGLVGACVAVATVTALTRPEHDPRIASSDRGFAATARDEDLLQSDRAEPTQSQTMAPDSIEAGFGETYGNPGLSDDSALDQDDDDFYQAQAQPEVQQSENCATAVPGEHCYEVVQWARLHGIHSNPEWYPGLTAKASFEDFQSLISTKHSDQGCGPPCTLAYTRTDEVWYRRQPRPLMKGITYSPSPEMEHGLLLADDDFTSEQAAPLWASWGRGDLATMKRLGANTVRLYDNDPRVAKRLFLDEAQKQGLDVILGISDFPYLQMPGKCEDLDFVCYDLIYDGYINDLTDGLAMDIDGRASYHPRAKALVLMNEPELKITDSAKRCRALVSALDGILQAEKKKNVEGNLIAFTIAFSTGQETSNSAAGVGQMDELLDCMTDPITVADYAPLNDVMAAFARRWVHSYNTALDASSQFALLKAYAESKSWKKHKIPLFAGEYHAPAVDAERDLATMMAYTRDLRFPFFLGFNFFEFQVRYDKMGKHEKAFGMYGLDTTCQLTKIKFFGKDFPIFDLKPRRPDDASTAARTSEQALSEAFGGKIRNHSECHPLPAIPSDSIPEDLRPPWKPPETAEITDETLRKMNLTNVTEPGDVVTKRVQAAEQRLQPEQEKKKYRNKIHERYAKRDPFSISTRLGGE
eukprot:TRINITY_DN5119_c1_g1_i2.p1 TRINITY_DN5119_c1_g1~~TRINITY_DN5119_c1_g1_i2.p1  ORF type:complete len:707 (+),score=130.86 TRINITY_DN5119_c1_g1_i2:73-2121(+)